MALVVLGAGAALTLHSRSTLEADEIKSGVNTVISREPRDTSVVAVAMPVPAVISKSAEFDRLAKTGNPTDALLAYRIAANCETAQAWRTSIGQSPNDLSPQQFEKSIASLPKVEDVCGDLTPAQRASRQQYIVKAGLAGVHGAFLNLTTLEGPKGMLHSFSDDARWRALEQEAMEAGLKTADPGTLLGRESFLYNCTEQDMTKCKPAPAGGLTLWVASETARAIDQGKLVPVFDPNLYTGTLSLEEAKNAIADGQALVATAQRQP
ncbi:MAG: hypothetical protein ABI277_07335 [Burkholderiaceae bacterium]